MNSSNPKRRRLNSNEPSSLVSRPAQGQIYNVSIILLLSEISLRCITNGKKTRRKRKPLFYVLQIIENEQSFTQLQQNTNNDPLLILPHLGLCSRLNHTQRCVYECVPLLHTYSKLKASFFSRRFLQNPHKIFHFTQCLCTEHHVLKIKSQSLIFWKYFSAKSTQYFSFFWKESLNHHFFQRNVYKIPTKFFILLRVSIDNTNLSLCCVCGWIRLFQTQTEVWILLTSFVKFQSNFL